MKRNEMYSICGSTIPFVECIRQRDSAPKSALCWHKPSNKWMNTHQKVKQSLCS